MLTADQIPPLISRMWQIHQHELTAFDRIDEYVDGKIGRPHIPDDADEEVKEIHAICVHNVLTLVLDAFIQNLSVVGYRRGDAEVNDEAWKKWQANRMDARQAEIYTSTVKYGVGYVVAERESDGLKWRPRSPRQLLALYRDPQVDWWPQYALETWVDSTDGKPRRKGLLFDATHIYPLDLGELSAPIRDEDDKIRKVPISVGESSVGTARAHGGVFRGRPVCPVVRYVNRPDSEDLIEGEIDRLVIDQRAINEVNFDRLMVARYGAHPQNVIAGWTGTRNDLLKTAVNKTWTFEDADVKASRLQGASLEPYNALIEKLEEHVARRAQISPTYVMSGMVNLSADALAAAERNQQRKLGAMRESHGESHEQLLQLSAAMDGDAATAEDESAEVIWKDTEARAFGAMTDGIYKIASALHEGLPIEPLLPLVPGISQQMITALKAAAEKSRQASTVTQLVSALRPAAAAATQDPQVAALAERTA
ncbi:phage portal protein [Mycobacterium sp. PSTR-4-N]|uniref:phage portal protein n=1 Tax=Mycobacterium sp. PSTR-4-N TaxID=2917745 RepID=UPI001F14E1E8|nr:phage portal protein [Mycobacterium sp. PSTR-4-N]MCG7592394.1 phage portal protein [Mycobacterium sp. PSTR-4-N]